MLDLEAARTSLAAFAEQVGREMTDAQVVALRLERRVTALVAPRQSGKSRSLAVLALWWASRHGGQHVLIVSAGEDAARRLLAEVRAIATSSPLLRGSVVDESVSLVRLANGSEIRCVPASERQVRGWTVDLLLVDEAQVIPDDLLLGAALPTTAARPDARIVLAGSAGPTSGAFYDFHRRGEAGSEHVAAFRWSLEDATWITASAIAAARESMSSLRFDAEYRGIFAGSTDALLTRQELDRAIVPVRLRGLADDVGDARGLLGVDWGATRDRSAAVGLFRVPEAGPGRFLAAVVHAWKSGHPLVGEGSVIDDLTLSACDWERVSPELNGIGQGCTQQFFRELGERYAPANGGSPRQRAALMQRRPAMKGVTTTATLKATGYGALKLMVNGGQLLIPEDAGDLIRELLLLQVDLTATGERIEARTGHDDLADALLLSLTPRVSSTAGRAGAVRMWAAQLAHAPAPAPMFVLPEREWPVPDPILQSVAGRELSVTPDRLGRHVDPDNRWNQIQLLGDVPV